MRAREAQTHAINRGHSRHMGFERANRDICNRRQGRGGTRSNADTLSGGHERASNKCTSKVVCVVSQRLPLRLIGR